MHKLESVFEYETHKIPRKFEIETGHPVQVRRLSLFLTKKKEIQSYNVLCCSSRPKSESESEKLDEYTDLAREQKTVKRENDSDTNHIRGSWNNLQEHGEKTWRSVDLKNNWNYLDHRIDKISWEY